MKGYILFRSKQLGVALSLVAIAFALRLLLDPVLHDRLPYTLFLLAGIVAVWLTSVTEAILVLVLGWTVGNWFFDEPRHSLAVKGVLDWLTNLSYWSIGWAVVVFARARRSARLRELNASVELRRREAAAAGSRQVFEVAPVGLAQVEPQSGLLLHVNPRLCQLTGYSEEEMVRKRLGELVSPVEGASDWATVSRQLATSGAALDMNLSRKDGERLRLSLRAALGQGPEHWEPRLVCVLTEPVTRPEPAPAAVG